MSDKTLKKLHGKNVKVIIPLHDGIFLTIKGKLHVKVDDYEEYYHCEVKGMVSVNFDEGDIDDIRGNTIELDRNRISFGC
jgi:hypothetical protein